MMAAFALRSWGETVEWCRRSAAFWLWLISVCAVSAIFLALPASASDRIRWAGIVFEFLGISLVILGVSRARQAFGRPSILKGWALLFADARFVFIRRPPRLYSLVADSAAQFEVRAGTAVLRKTGTVEERVEQLEKEVLELTSLIGALEGKLREEISQLRQKVEAEITERRASDERTSKRLEEGLIGDSNLEIAGVAYLYLSLLLINFPSEVASVLGRIGIH